MNDSSTLTQVDLFQRSIRAVLFLLPSLFFFSVNIFMLLALLKKPLLLESSRYILFGHLLFTESLQLFVTNLMYIIAVTRVRMMSYVCVFFTVFATTTVKMSPVNLAVMSLERYVAICFPLRHTEIASARRTGIAIAVMWSVGSLDSLIQLLLFFSLEKTSFSLKSFCYRNRVFRLKIYAILSDAFIILYFVSVSLIIIFTYIAIMITVKSASSNVRNGSKAHKTVLLHLIQLGLCLTSPFFNMIDSHTGLQASHAVDIQYALFVSLIIFPKCLSPLIYGLRDQTLRQVIKQYLTFSCKIYLKPKCGV
ncbi:odorant receptor 131-2-like [Halichoeres trimaculatus]|uniref:odorant receptor 131-2-like n=1 Tax=Halichoeres trimaculatus TaxID=147232 RepID=UPI003D9F795F